MMYYIFTLKFLTPVHFGNAADGGFLDKVAMSCGADTLFAALCQEAALQGQEFVEQFIDKITQRKIVLSSLMPYFCDTKNNEDMHFYLPKPLLTNAISKRELKSFSEVKRLAAQYKKQKNISFIRASQIKELVSGYEYGEAATVACESFAVPYVSGRAALREDKPNSYYVGSYVFAANAGLYFICGVNEDEDEDIDFVENLLVNLGYSGIGGKRSSGYGKFELRDDRLEVDEEFYSYDDDEALAKMLHDEDSNLQMCIAPLCPLADEIADVKKGTYKLIKRGGFIASPELAENIKRDSVYMLAEGSCFAKRLHGQMIKQRVAGVEHGIYRNGLGLFVGLRGEADAAGK